MDFPVDVLDSRGHGELEALAHSYMNKLLYSNPDHAQHITLPSGQKVEISLSTVGLVPLYGSDDQHKVLALFAPQDQFTAAALFLDDQWYAIEDILKTANPTREGLIEVRSVGERIVLYVLNRIVYRANEMTSGEVPFLCHGANDYAKIFWENGEAVGFYSVKPKGSLCNNSARQCYHLPVMDSIFVRKAHRGKNHGLQMLEDFVDCFEEHELGVKYPLSPAMADVCRRYITRYPADVDLLWEVQGVGGPYQRARLATKLASQQFNADLGRTEDAGQNGNLADEDSQLMEETSLDITEEVIVVKKSCKEAEETSTPVVRSQSSEYKRRKRLRDEAETNEDESQPEKINRLAVAEEKREESLLANQTPDESVASAPPGKVENVFEEQAEDQKEGKEEMDEVESLLQNGAARKDEQTEMEMMEEEVGACDSHAAKETSICMDTSIDLDREELEKTTTEQQEVVSERIARAQTKDEDVASEEEKAEVEDLAGELNEKGINKAEDLTKDPSLAEKQQEVFAADEDQDMTGPADEEPEGSSGSDEQQKADTENMTFMTDQPDTVGSEGQQEIPTVEKEQTSDSFTAEPSGAGAEEEERPEETSAGSSPAEETPETAVSAEEKEKQVAPLEEGREVFSATTGAFLSTSAPTDEERGQFNDMNTTDIQDEDVTGTPPKKENDSRKMDDEEEPKKSEDIQVLGGTRPEVTERLRALVQEDQEPREAPEEGKIADEGVELEFDEDPPVIDRRMLRGKTKAAQATSRSKSKRQSRK